ncbi:MAG: pilus assembly protein N-terminal domain-containing protein [Candidatus Eremiobacteraeota bacterium]|nr:pilus assembly protein N-terminal domain-containing protein [Candidatus Eremiobacteraeota bacterium]
MPSAALFRAALPIAACAALLAADPLSSPSPTPSASPNPSGGPSFAPPAPAGSPAATPPPLSIAPAAATVGVGSAVNVTVGSAISPIAATVRDPSIAAASVDQASQRVVIVGKAPGVTSVHVTDARNISADVPVRVAFYAGSIAGRVTLQLTGNPASAQFVREQAAQAVRDAAQRRPDAQVIVSSDDMAFRGNLEQDDVASFDVPVLVQGTNDIEVDGSTHVDVQNVAVPRISPNSLMVSDYPERLTENGTLFTADLRSEQPSRFLYFHYNPRGQPDRRIVLRAENLSREPSIVQFISGRGGPSSNEMEVGHSATRRFLVNVVQNQGRLLTIGGNTSLNIVTQDLPAGSIVCNLLQLRVLSGGNVHLTLFSQDATDSPDAVVAGTELLQYGHIHARGIYPIAEFHFASQWRVDQDYLELPIGQLPLPNHMQGQALSGDYGVLQSFVVNIENPLSTPQSVAIYENPRGGRSTGTYLIDGVLVQSHQVPPYSRYKVRQYVVPAHGFVRVAIVTMPEAGSSLPLKLIFAPDDGSVAPGAPGSPIY